MIRTLFLAGLALSAVGAQGQAGPGDWVEACLATPSQDCALRTALRVVVDEELAIERAKVLVALAGSLARLGQESRALQTLDLAKREAEAIGISVGTEQTYVEIAEIYGRMGRPDGAVALANEIEDRILRARAMAQAGVGLVRAGQAERGLALIGQAEVPAIARRHMVQAAEYLAFAPGQAEANALDAAIALLEDDQRQLLRELGELRLALAQAEAGAEEQALAVRDRIAVSSTRILVPGARARLLAGLALLDDKLGDMRNATLRLNRAIREARNTRSSYDRDQALAVVAVAAARLGRFDRAVELGLEIESLDRRGRMANAMAAFAEDASVRQALVEIVRRSFDDIAALDSRFSRDKARYALLTALVDGEAAQAAVELIAAMEDDDAQAQGLAYLARLLG